MRRIQMGWLVCVTALACGWFGGLAIGRIAVAARTADSCQITATAVRNVWTGWQWQLDCHVCADNVTGCEVVVLADGSRMCACPGVEELETCTVLMSPLGNWPYCPTDGPCPPDTYCKKKQPPSSATYYECYCSTTP